MFARPGLHQLGYACADVAAEALSHLERGDLDRVREVLQQLAGPPVDDAEDESSEDVA